MSITLEVCVDDPAGLEVAACHGADRIELCAALALGGLTPSAGLMRLAARCALPVMAMIRPRAGNFCWSEPEIDLMEADIRTARAAGLAGVVLGASLSDGRLDREALSRLIHAAEGLDLTLHRCFDLVPDPLEAMEQAIELGFSRILTSGGALLAPEGVGQLAQLIAAAHGRIGIMPGAGVSVATLPAFAGLALREIHASCSIVHPAPHPAMPRLQAFGFAPAQSRQTDGASVAALRQALDARA